jgi:hypothetical protein
MSNLDNKSHEELRETLRRGIRAFSRFKDRNPDAPENDELVDYLTGQLAHSVKAPPCASRYLPDRGRRRERRLRQSPDC